MDEPAFEEEFRQAAEKLADQFEAYDPKPEDRRDPAPMNHLRKSVAARVAAERDIVAAVSDARDAGYSWSIIGTLLGTSEEAAIRAYANNSIQKNYRRSSEHFGAAGAAKAEIDRLRAELKMADRVMEVLAKAVDYLDGDVICPSEDELRQGVARVLERLGCSFAELEEMYRNNDFVSLDHRLAWLGVGKLGDLAPEVENKDEL